jgi:hypothetical protein
MTRHEQKRLLAFLKTKQCAPCRRGNLDPTRSGCLEAEDLVDVIANEVTNG